ncbi:MAG TPA: NCS2 family permease [Cyclobacteriaceae bacterium]|nr:NCS2 family permease [Cyclobacteriaceae bacterium]
MSENLPKSKSSFVTELIAGASSFMATAYIIVVNPSILSNTGMPFPAILTATIIVSSFSSITMGWYARNPILVAPGMGINAFFTFSVVLGMKVPWEVALGAVFWAGLVFMLLALFNVRAHIVKAIPKALRHAIAAGIGLFISLIGFVNAGFIVHNEATVVGIGEMNTAAIVFIVGLLITAVLVIRKILGAVLIGIVITTILTYTVGAKEWVTMSSIFAAPDFSLLFKLDLVNSLSLAMVPVIFSFVFTGMFDGLSTFLGLSEAAGLLDEHGEPRNIKRSLATDAVSTMLAGLSGSSPGTAYIESAVGIEAGGRTGLTAIVGGLLFLPFLFLSPLLSAIPSIATAPALVLVGVFMISPVVNIPWSKLDDAIPAFIAMILIPFSYSITQGIVWGFLSWTVIKVSLGKWKEVSITLWIIDVCAVVALALND